MAQMPRLATLKSYEVLWFLHVSFSENALPLVDQRGAHIEVKSHGKPLSALYRGSL